MNLKNKVSFQRGNSLHRRRGLHEGDIRKVAYVKVAISAELRQLWLGSLYQPTLEEASVKLLSVELFPAEGFPTRPISGSRGMTEEERGRFGNQVSESSEAQVRSRGRKTESPRCKTRQPAANGLGPARA